MNNFKNIGVSIVICCYNSASRLPETLKHLLVQDAPIDLQWEVILVDNASTDDTAYIGKSLWPDDAPVNLRIVHEQNQGLSYARERGIDEAMFGLVSFVDDDNWLSSDWVRRVSIIMTEHPEVGACGGRSEAIFESEPLFWFEEFNEGYAVGKQGESTGDVTWSRGHLWGAGLTIRKAAWKQLREKGFTPILSDRKGKSLSSGGDYEICYALRLAGWRLWYCDELVFKHHISAERNNWNYLKRLQIGFGAQTIGHDPYYYYINYKPSEIRKLFGGVWIRQLLREVYTAVFRDRSIWHALRINNRNEWKRQICWLNHLGRMKALLKQRSKYDDNLVRIRNAKWIKVEQQTAKYFQENPALPQSANFIFDHKPLVTALICNYNYGRYIADAIDSALGQTYKNMEVIVVDDGSTDESRKVLKRFKGKIHTIFKENGGQASAFNIGISEAKGDILCFLDSDDFWFPNKIEQIVSKYHEAPWGLVCHDLQIVDEAGKNIGNKTHSQTYKIKLCSGDILIDQFKKGFGWFFAPTSGMSIPKTIAEKVFPIPEKEWRICADNPIAYGATCHAPVGVIDYALGAYRLHGSNSFGSKFNDNSFKRLDYIITNANRYFYLNEHLKRLNRPELTLQPKDLYRYYRSCCFIVRDHPLRFLLQLWKRNIGFHFSPSNRYNILKISNLFRYLFLDTIIAVLILVGFPTRYSNLRQIYNEKASSLSYKIRNYLEND